LIAARASHELRFVAGRCVRVDDTGENEVSLETEDPREALDLIRVLNRLETEQGRRVSSLVTADGFEPWWFVQDQLFHGWLVPFTRYRPVVRRALEGERIVEPPPALDRLLKLVGTVAAKPFEISGRSRFFRGALERGLGALLRSALGILSWVTAIGFRLRGKTIVLYAIDVVSPGSSCDFRLEPLYRELARRGYRYGEYLHSLEGLDAIKNLFRRGRSGIFLSAAAAPWQALSAFSYRRPATGWKRPAGIVREEDWLFLQALASYGLEAATLAAGRYRACKRLLRLHRPKGALILDDSRHAHELVAACQELSIPVVGYQHGLAFNEYFTGLMAYGFEGARRHVFDAYGLWSEYFRQRLLQTSDLFDAKGTFVSGLLRPPLAAAAPATPRVDGNDPIAVQVVSETLARTREVVPYVRKLLETLRFEVTLKLRPGEQPGPEWAGLGARLRTSTAEVYESFRHADVVLGTYSSVLYEAILALRPVVVVKTSSPFGFTLGEEGLAELADRPEAIESATTRAAGLPLEELERRRRVVWGDTTLDGARAIVDRLAGLLV